MWDLLLVEFAVELVSLLKHRVLLDLDTELLDLGLHLAQDLVVFEHLLEGELHVSDAHEVQFGHLWLALRDIWDCRKLGFVDLPVRVFGLLFSNDSLTLFLLGVVLEHCTFIFLSLRRKALSV